MIASRSYILSAFILTLLFAAVIGLIRAQPYDDAELRAFIMPDGCPMPCFMGIRPGMTTVDEALAILESHEWIGVIDNDTSVNDSVPPPNIFGFIDWAWSGQQPETIDGHSAGRVVFSSSRVSRIYIPTHIRLADIRFLFGPSAVGALVTASIEYRSLQLYYAEEQLGVVTSWRCPVDFGSFWNAGILLAYREEYQGPTDAIEISYPIC